MKLTILVIGGKPIRDFEAAGWADVEQEMLKLSPRLFDNRGGGYKICYSINGENATRESPLREGDVVTICGVFFD